jgi:hypothetical protein
LGNLLVLGTLAVNIIALIAFLLVEARITAPMVPLTLFRSSTFSGTNLLTFLLYAALGGATYFLPFNLIQVQGYSTAAAGAALAPFALIMFLLSCWTGGVVKRFGAKLPLADRWTIHHGTRLPALCRAKHRRDLLDNLLPRRSGHEPGHGH